MPHLCEALRVQAIIGNIAADDGHLCSKLMDVSHVRGLQGILLGLCMGLMMGSYVYAELCRCTWPQMLGAGIQKVLF